MATTFSTSSIGARNRFRYWQRLMWQNVALADGTAEDDDGFDARVRVSALGAATVLDVSAPFQSWHRSREQVRRSPRDEYLMTMMLSGSGRLQQDGNEVVQGPGVMTLYDTDRPFSYQLSGHILFVKIPRQQLRARLDDDVKVATPMLAGTALGGFAEGIIRQGAALDLPAGSPACALVGSTLLDAIAALHSAGDDGRPAGGLAKPSPLLDRVKRHVSENLGNTSLSLETMARAAHVSTRTLNRAFAILGTTPMRWVWQERLAACRRDLLEGCEQRVTDAAFKYGFSDLSHFSRAFRNEFGLSPRRLISR